MCKKVVLVSLAILMGCGLSLRTGFAGSESIAGKWQVKAETANGTRELEFEFKLEGTTLTGFASSTQGTAPFATLKFEDPDFNGELNTGRDVFKITGTLKGGKFSGTWEQMGRDSKGAWTAERKADPAPAATAEAPVVAGIWNAVASSPNGNLEFQVEVKQTGGGLTGAMITPGGSIALQKPEFSHNMLTFLVDYQGGTYRVEMTLAGDKLSGKWTSLDGSENGKITAERKKP